MTDDGQGARTGVRAGIVATGSELLTGRITDRNGPWVAERLGELGVEVSHLLLVGDRGEDMAAALRFLAGDGVDLVVTTGGLGPTADDLTGEVVAAETGRPLELDEHMEKVVGDIIAKFADRLRWDADALAAANRKQAMVPRGATPIRPAGTAPGLAVPPDGERGGPTVLVLPGPPREVRAMWDDALATDPVREVLARTEPYAETHLRLFGVPESEIAATLRDVGEQTDLEPLEITTCLRDFTLEVDLRHAPGSTAAGDGPGRGDRRDRPSARAQRLLAHRADASTSCCSTCSTARSWPPPSRAPAGCSRGGSPRRRARRRTSRAASSRTRTTPRPTCSACPAS